MHQAHSRVEQQPDGAVEEMLLGHEVGIEHRHEVAGAQGQAGVEIAGFGMQPLGPVVVAAAMGRGEGCHLWPPRVIEDPHRALRIGKAAATHQAALQHG